MLKKFSFFFLITLALAGLTFMGCGKDKFLPVVVTGNVSNVNSFSALVTASVTDAGGSAVTTKGVCWSLSSNPEIDGLATDNGGGIGEFTCAISNLSSNTTYYVRAYATNSDGTAYGQQVTFKTTSK